MKKQTGQIHIVRASCRLKVVEQTSNSGYVCRVQTSWIVTFV